MTASEGKIYVERGFQRLLKGTEDQKVYLNKSELKTSLICGRKQAFRSGNG